jgi:hypothetical protein
MSRTFTTPSLARFEPASFNSFRFLGRSLDAAGNVSLRYALDDVHEFEERMRLPITQPRNGLGAQTLDGLLDLLHWVAGVSYYKAAAPASVSCESGAPAPAARALLEALYSQGLGEFAAVNGLASLPCPSFAEAEPPAPSTGGGPIAGPLRRLLVPVGGGKDSAVALEIARRAPADATLFSIGDAAPISGTVAVAGLPRLLATRRLDPRLLECNAAGALNGHVPVTAIVSCVALLTAALNGLDAVLMANERSASSPNVSYRGVEVNHQFSKGALAERLLSAAAGEVPGAPSIFSVLRPASELAIARAFARMPQYHPVFTSCNRVFRIDPERRGCRWCGDCDKCRFVFLILAPFMSPDGLVAIFGRDLLQEAGQFDGFAILTATGSHKPFECVGEERESAAAIALLARDPRWREHTVVRRLAAEVLPRFNADDVDPESILALSDEHQIPPELIGVVRAVLGA